MSQPAVEQSGERPCCCCGIAAKPSEIVQVPPTTNHHWIVGMLDTPVGPVPQVSTRLVFADHLGAWRVRWAVGRMRYQVDPGLYAVGRPDASSPVLVSANYKMSFDRLRSQLTGIDAWILVLNTRAINVWCSAGKGTFGTDELVGRVKANRLEDLVSHRTLVLPQLSAPGVAAHQVKNRCGFKVVYGPVRAKDLPEFLANGMKATPEMRKVEFPLFDRLVLVPVEMVRYALYIILAAVIVLLLSGFGPDGYSWQRVGSIGLLSATLLLASYVGGNILGPALLPWLPGRALSLKGFWLGIAFLLVLIGTGVLSVEALGNNATILGFMLVIPALVSYVTMSFVGSTTYTSLSGVKREMRFALPLQITAAISGLIFWLTGRFI